MSIAERDYITRGFEQDIRNDGRCKKDIRLLEMELDVVPQANGSARVRLGGTDVIVGVKAEIASPDMDTPDAGRLLLSVECSPVASSAFRGRGGEDLSSELTASLERSLFFPSTHTASPHAPISLNSLCIIPGKTCWSLYVDALLISIDGCPIDAISVAIKAALAATLLPRVELAMGEDPDDEPDYELIDDPSAATRIDVSNIPVTISVGVMGRGAVGIDLTSEEEHCADAILQVAVSSSGSVCGVTKAKGHAIDCTVMMVRFWYL